MDMIGEMMKNPEMMAQMGEMMKNPEMMAQMNEMMKNPETLSNILNMGGNLDNSNSTTNQLYQVDDIIKTIGLENDTYNNRVGKILSYDATSERYQIELDDMEKQISIKETNIELVDEPSN